MTRFKGNFIVFMIFTLVFSFFPFTPMEIGIAKTKKTVEIESTNDVPSAPPIEKQVKKKLEKVELRKAKEKVFNNGDGTYTKEVYSKPIFKKNKEKFEEISSELVESNQKIKPKNTFIDAEFYKQIENGSYASIKNGEYFLNYKLLDATDGKVKVNPFDSKAKYKKNILTYDGVYPNVDLRNIISDDIIKEDLVIKKKTNLNVFRFVLDTNLSVEKKEDGSLIFNNDKNEEIFILPKPFMADSNINKESKESARSENVRFDVKKSGDEEWILTLTADSKWLNDSERVYPIYIDPTTKSASTLEDTFVSDAYPTTNYGAFWDSSAGFYSLKTGKYDSSSGLNYSYLKQDVASFKYSVIDSATLKLYTGHSYYGDTPTGVWVDEVGSAWSEGSMTWNTKASTRTANIASDSVYRGQWAEFPVTSTVKKWVDGTSTNYGFKLHTSTFGTSYWKKFYSSENSSNKPFLSVTYHYPTTDTPTSSAFNTGNNAGYVNLSWDKVTGATGYKVWIFNGKAYESFDVGNVSSWTSRGKGIWPTASEISAGRFDLHQDGLGTELAEDPRPVYINSGGGTYDTRKNYAIRVSAVFSGGESSYSEAAVPTIPNLDIPETPTGQIYTNGNGTGYTDLNWKPVTGATGYKVWIFNGVSYEAFDVGNVTTWSTKGLKIWPTTTEIDAGKYALHQDGLGRELVLDPSPVYANAGTRYATSKNYWFRVSAYNTQGQTVYSTGAFMPTLPDLLRPAAPTGIAYRSDVNTGFVDLEWTPIANATGYKVWIFNGKAYEAYDVGNILEWSTVEKGIWPTEEEIIIGDYDLHQDGLGAELPLDPSSVYANAGTTYATSTKYWFRLSAYNAQGETIFSSDAFMPYIPNGEEFEEPSSEVVVNQEGAEIDQRLDKLTPYININEQGIVTIDTERALSENVPVEDVELANLFYQQQNSLVNRTINNGESIEQIELDPEYEAEFAPYFDYMSETENAPSDEPETETSSEGTFSPMVLIPTPGGCGGSVSKPHKCPPRYTLMTKVSQSYGQKYLESIGYHRTAPYAGGAQYWNPARDFTKKVTAYGCRKGAFRNQGVLAAKGSKYNIIVQYNEPNPEIHSYIWPNPTWANYTHWWHIKYCN